MTSSARAVPERPHVMVTGASGFIGRHLGAHLVARGMRVTGMVRNGEAARRLPDRVTSFVSHDIAETAWGGVLRDVNAVVHLAAHVHVPDDASSRASDRWVRTNVLGTVRLAEAAAEQGVQTFIFMSSAAVAGVGRLNPYTEADAADPRVPYAQSKLEAELALDRVAAASLMRIVSLRPPLIYGADAPGNFKRLASLIKLARWSALPFGGIDNRRSFVFIDNLIDAIEVALDSRRARGAYYVSDDDDMSTTGLIRAIADACAIHVRLVSMPGLVRFAAGIVGTRSDASKLLESFAVSPAKFRADTGWSPRFSAVEGVRRSFAATRSRDSAT